MIYDCFTFYNELDLLELRLNILYDYVDRFVIVEGNKTHTGSDKEFILEKNLSRYKNFSDKIIYIKVDDFPKLEESKNDVYGNNWLYENFQRDAIMRGLTECKPDDVIIISDCDEIIKPECIQKYDSGIYSLKQLNLYYKYNSLSISGIYTKKAKICQYKDLIDPKQDIGEVEYCKFSKYGLPSYLRFCKGKNLYNSGWHFSYISDSQGILEKRKSIVEQQYNTQTNMTIEKIEQMLNAGKDVLERDDRYVNLKLSEKVLPKYLVDNHQKYSKFINYNNQVSFGYAEFKSLLYKNFSIRHVGNNINGKPYLRILGLKLGLKKGEKS